MSITKNKVKLLVSLLVLLLQSIKQPFLIYFIPFLLSKKTIPRLYENLHLLLFCFLLFSSYLIRGYPIALSFEYIRYYCGVFFFLCICDFKWLPQKSIINSFIIICIFEIIYNYFNEIPLNIKYYFSSFAPDYIDRAKISEDRLRIYGPCLNSSITGVWAALFFLILNFDAKYFNCTNISKKYTFFSSLLLLIIIFSAASGTAFFVFIIGLLLKSSYLIKNNKIKIFLFISTIFLFYFQEKMLKLNLSYILEILNIKRDQILFYAKNNVFNILFGRQFTENKYGGDFSLIDFLTNNGLVFGFFYFYFFKKVFSNKNLYFFLLCASSIHYSTIFSVTSQLLVGVFFCKNYIKNNA